MRLHIIGDSVSEGAGALPLQHPLPLNVQYNGSFTAGRRPLGWVAYLSMLLAASFPTKRIVVTNDAIGGQGPEYFWHCGTVNEAYNAVLFQCVRPTEQGSWDKLLSHYRNAILVGLITATQSIR